MQYNIIYDKPLRDPIFNYIDLTPIEQTIIDLPVFQRLRYILQNSSAHLTYPNNTTSRFIHSLGTMHISGIYFIRSLENSNGQDLADFLKLVDLLIAKYQNDLETDAANFYNDWQSNLGNASRFNHRPKNNSIVKFEKKPNSI